MNAVRRLVQGLYYRAMSPVWRRGFVPRIVEVNLPNCNFEFFVGTEQAARWYDPPRRHTILEYSWILDNIDIDGQKVIDGGAHHGHYSLLFAKAVPGAAHVRAVEPLPSNCALIRVNSSLNEADIIIEHAALSGEWGMVRIVPRENARISPTVGLRVPTVTLSDVMADASIVKLDIEGSEFNVLPSQIDEMVEVHTWIIEIHPGYGEASELAGQFLSTGFRGRFLDRSSGSVLRIDESSSLNESTTLFFSRR